MRYRACRINHSDRPWAVIDNQGPLGDEIAVGGIAQGDQAQRIADFYERQGWRRGMAAIKRSLTPDALALFRIMDGG